MLPLVFILIIYQSVASKANDYSVIDLSDILNADYMPGSLLVLENPQESNQTFNNSTLPLQQGTFNDAFATMDYHRKMMNEYLCRGYVSQQILTEMRSPRIRRRLGNPADDKVEAAASKINFPVQNGLLDDEGSSNYKSWLQKSTTLEDIYRHYDKAESRDGPESVRDNDEDEEPNEDYDGHIAGYGYQQPQSGSSPSKLGHSGTGMGYSYPSYPSGHMMHSGGGGGLYHGGGGSGGGHSGYGSGGTYLSHSDHPSVEGVTGHSGHGHSYGGHDHSPKYYGGHDEKDKLGDLFDIALTALAFLSFGMFIVQVIMCISMTGTTTAPAMTMMPMSMSTTGDNGGMTGNDMMGGGTMGDNGGSTDGGAGGDGDMGGEGDNGGGNGDGTMDGDAGGGGTTGNGDGDNGGNGGDGNNGGMTGAGDGGSDGGGNGGSDNGGNASTGGDNGNDGGDGAGATDGDGGMDEGTGGTGTATGGTGTGATADGRDGASFRNRRDIPVIVQPQNEALNNLARRILISIEAVMVANQDDGNCLRKTLCENSFYSRNLESDQKFWIPVWSLGMSWLSGRIVKNVASTTTMLDSLKASLLGLGKADCEMIYRKCDLGKERQKRRRRRKRSVRK